jgi:hypothetical protein
VKTGGVVQVNPLAAITAGNQAAQSEFATRRLQAEQAIGQIMQQSTDENGNVDWQGAHKRAAAAGPIVQMGMSKFAGEAAQLRGSQITQAGSLHGLMAGLSASLMDDPSDENLARIDATAAAVGLPAATRAEIARLKTLSPEQRVQDAYKHQQTHLDALGRLARSPYAMPEMTDTGTGGRVPVQNVPRSPYGPGGATVGPGGVTTGPTAGQTTTSTEPFDEQGQIPRDANGVPTRTPKTWQSTTVPVTAVPGVPTGGQQIGGGSGAPSVTPPPPPPGTRVRPAGKTTLPPPPPEVLEGPLPPPGAGTTPAPSASPARPPIVTEPPQGQPQALKANQEEYRKDQANVQPMMTSAQNMGKAYQALRLLKEMNSTTGVGAAGWQAFRSRMGALGLLPDSSMKVQQQQEEFAKYTEKLMLDAAGGTSTNLGKEMAERSNPSNIIGMAANFDFLRSNLGERLQAIAAQQVHEDKTGSGYLSHKADIATKTDPRGFVWFAYDDDEKAKIRAEAERDGPEAVARLKRAIGLSHQLNLTVPGATQPPPPDKRSMLVPPPPPQPNALAMAG